MLKKVRESSANHTLSVKQVCRVYSAQEFLSYSQSYENIKHSTEVSAQAHDKNSCAQCICQTIAFLSDACQPKLIVSTKKKKKKILSENLRLMSDLKSLRQCLLCILECDPLLLRCQQFVLQPLNQVLLSELLLSTRTDTSNSEEAVTDFGSRTSLWSSVSLSVILAFWIRISSGKIFID